MPPIVFLLLAIWGAVHPMSHFLAYMAETGWSLGALIDSWFVNRGAEGLVWDLTISAIALTVWVLSEAVSRRWPTGLVAIPATFCIGVSCGLPLYLWLRARRGA